MSENWNCMQFLSVSRRKPGVSDEASAALRGDEAQRVRELYSEGLLRQIWHRADRPGACIIWEAANEQQVRDMLDTLPFARAQMLEIEIIPLMPYGGFGPKQRP
jgi:muconolactone delta-isomerase